jgi:hypothetical protein
MNQQINKQESSESYAHVILKSGEKHRVIQCRDNIQWILQIHSGEVDGSKRFRNLSYIRTRGPLIDACRSVNPDITKSELNKLEKLPAVCGA